MRTIAHEVQGHATVLMPSPAVARDRLERVYVLAQRLRPAIVVLEDLDLLLDRRHSGSNLVSFLAAVDGSTTEHVGVITIATTNNIDVLDEAVLRSSRLDRHIEVPLPGDEARHAILQRLVAPLDRNFELGQLVAPTAGMSGADLRDLIRTAVLTDTLHTSGLRELAHTRRADPVTAGHYL